MHPLQLHPNISMNFVKTLLLFVAFWLSSLQAAPITLKQRQLALDAGGKHA